MKTLTTLLFSSLLFATPVMAGSGHDHGHSHAHEKITSEEAVKLASLKVQQLIEAGKIDTTWTGVEMSNIEQKTFSHDPEWVIKFENNKVSDPSKQTLYLFFSLGGRYIAANYTGK